MNRGKTLLWLVVGLGTVACSTENTPSSEADSIPAVSVSQTTQTAAMQATSTPAAVERVDVTLNWPGTGGGNVFANPPLLACGATSGGVQSCTFPKGVEVVLSAEPVPGSRFVGWGGECEDAGTSDTCVVNIDGETTITVLFD